MSDLEAPSLTMSGEDFAALFAAVQDDAPEGGMPRRARVTVEEAAADEEDRAELIEISRVIPGGPPMRKKRILMTMHEIVKLHASPNGLGYQTLIGRELTKDGFVERLCDYLTIKVKASQKFDKDTKQPLKNKKGKPVYMAFSTLITLTFLVTPMLKLMPVPALSPRELIEGRDLMLKHVSVLAKRYHLTHRDRRITTLYATDIKALIETTFARAGTSYDIATQFCCMLTTFMYTGARPGSILSTSHYPAEFLTWKAVVWKPLRDDEGVTVGFDVSLTLSAFKGYMDLSALRIHFLVRAVKSASNAILDLGMWMMAHGFRRGVFGTRSLDDIWQSDKATIKVDPEFEDQPIFVSRSRTGLRSGALKDGAATKQLKAAMSAAGIRSSAPYSDTLYALRRGFATNARKNMSKDIAKFYMGHQANSSMLESTYDQSALDTNVTAGVLGPGEERTMVMTPLTLLRNDPTDMPTVTLEEALKAHPEYRHFYSKLQMLSQCLQYGTSQWKSVSPFRELKRSKRELSNASLPVIIKQYRLKLQNLVKSIKTQKYRDLLERDQQGTDMLNYQIIKERASQANKPSQLALDLQKRLLKQELNLLQEEPSETSEDDDSFDVIEIENIFDENEEEEEEEEDEEDDEENLVDDEAGVVAEAAEGQENDVGEDDAFEMWDRDENDKEEEGDVDVTDEQERRMTEIDNAFAPAGPGGVSAGDEEDNDTEGAGILDGLNLDDAVSQKLATLRSLVTLIDPNESGKLCELCQQDDTVTPKMKGQLWKTGTKLTRHIIQVHCRFHRCQRWLHSSVVNDKWRCPFRQGQGKPVDSDGDVSMADAGAEDEDGPCDVSYALGSYKKSAPLHLALNHPGVLSDDFLYVLHPDTRKAANKEVGQRQKEAFGREMSKAKAHYNGRFEQYLLPGTFEAIDFFDPFHQDLSLGPSIFANEQISFETDAIPDGLLSETGHLLL